MARRVTDQEIAATERFDRFVADHVGQAAFWFVIPRHERNPDSFIHHVEFDTDQYHRPDSGHGDEASLFLMDILTVQSLDPMADAVSVEHSLDKRIRVSDPGGELGIILDSSGASRRRNWARSAGLLMDHLLELEEAGHFVPGYRRYVELTA